MTEFIIIQVGQCGNQIGSSLWPLILQEYGIQNVPGEIKKTNLTNSKLKLDDSFNSFFCFEDKIDFHKQNLTFSDLKKYNIKARAILIDMEDSVVDRFHSGPFKHFFDETCTIKNYPGSGNNWAEGFITHGTKYRHIIEDILRKTVEKCNCLVGFLVLYSVGGGTGSGLGSFVLQMLENLYPNIDRFVTCVYPNGSEDVITGPYNMALATKYLTDFATCVFPVENRALLDIVKKYRNQKNNIDTNNFIVKCKPFQDMNCIIVNMLLHLTSGSRFSGGLNVDMSDLSTNLVPFPNVNFICSSVSPIVAPTERFKLNLSSRKIHHNIFQDCLDRKNQLLKINPLGLNSILLGTTLIARGDFTVTDMRKYVQIVQDRGKFTQWSPYAIKVGLCDTPPAGYERSMLGLFNCSAMSSVFEEVLQQFNKLYIKQAHIHHYTKIDGFELDYFEECKESLLSNINNYKTIYPVQEKCLPRIKII